METYRIRVGGEWATIALEGWRTALGHEQGEVLVHSSFGSWAHQWASMGLPLKHFLQQVGYESLAAKMLGAGAQTFDYDASLEHWKRSLVKARRRRMISSDEFRNAWDVSCCDMPCSLDLFLWRIQWAEPDVRASIKRPGSLASRSLTLWHDVERHAVYKTDPQFRAFWDELWPRLVLQLRSEMVAANEPVVAA